MNGLVIWAHSYCRSTLAFFLYLGKSSGKQFKLFVRKPSINDIRTKVGFSNNEFNDEHIEYISSDFDKCNEILLKYKSWNHLFGAYQKMPLFQALINSAINNKIVYGIASEAPCNMSMPPKRYLKDLYLRLLLPIKLRKYVKNASFLVNLSGNDDYCLNYIGWTSKQIIHCGYYSPPIPNSNPVLRGDQHWQNFTILLSGIHEWHRSPNILLNALKILNDRGLNFKCIITQNGPLLDSLKAYATTHNLTHKIDFLGFVEMKKLIQIYENCSVYIGAGNYEPWGMRLNDVLQCGAPLIVNQGMGGKLLVDKYKCGLTFKRNNPVDLANQLEKLIQNKKKYLEISQCAYSAAKEISPQIIASQIYNQIRHYANW